MKTASLPSLLRLGSARRLTRADTTGPKMELIPGRYYHDTGVRADVVGLGSARAETRSVDRGEQLELIPGQFWPVAGGAL